MMTFIQKHKTIFSIVGIFTISIVVIGVYWFRHQGDSYRVVESYKIKKPYLTISELPRVTATTTGQIEQLLEEAFASDRLVVSSTMRVGRSGTIIAFAAPSFSKDKADVGVCDLRDNAYCGLFAITSTSSRLIAYGSKLVGFNKIERFIDPEHAQVLTSWSLLNFTSIDRKMLNLKTGEMSPMLITETDQDNQSASLNVSGDGHVLSLIIEGSTIQSQLKPERVYIKDAEGRVVSELSPEAIQELQSHLSSLKDARQMKSIFVRPTDQDVMNKTLQIDLYGVAYTLDIEKRILTKM